ncbi:MAG: ribose 5-phosphate isomerase B [Bacteriovoracaceae bacterium]|jgi:ribose 5-phosphate isomerase B|nr:ribose 5-phosphate isomerase B [Bacteriovoracaceae bacterium]
MKIAIGCDHAAFEEKEQILTWLKDSYEVSDCGTFTNERCDYPDFAKAVAAQVTTESILGILICGSGIGISMAANRYAGIRAALCRSVNEAELSKQHNNANVLCLGARITAVEEMKKIISAWFSAGFEEGRHTGRVAKFNDLGEILS